MVTMTAIWDRTAEVLRGRGSMLAGIAGLLIFVPSIVQNAMGVYGGKTSGALALGGLIGLVAAVMTIWGNLALVAAASDPLVDRPGAIGIGGRRLGPAIGLSVLIGLVVVLAALPGLAMAATGLLDLSSLAAGGMPRPVANPSPGLAAGAGLYLFVFGLVCLWLTARLALFWPVLVNERRGIGTIARSFELTRGLTWRIVGVAILFAILLVVALSAAQLVTSLAARLLLGADGADTARFLGSVVGAVVTAAGTVVAATFAAQLYRVVSGREAAHTFA